MRVETYCSNAYCPKNQYCANFSTDKNKNLVEFEFEFTKAQESDEVDTFKCDNFVDNPIWDEEEFYK